MASSLTDSSLSTIYVGDIPAVINRDDIQSVFQSYGNIIDVQMKNGQRANSNYALITFETHDQAANAIRELNYSKIEGKPIRVTWKRIGNESYDQEANLVISNLPLDVEEQSLHTLIEQFGEVISCRILRNREGQSTGRGYIQFVNASDAARALEELKGAQISDQTITIEKFLPKNQRQNIPTPLPPNVIAVEGAPDLILDTELTNLFGKYGKITEITHIDGLGIVFFERAESAINATKEFSAASITIKKQVRKDITQQVAKMNEDRTIFVSDLTNPNENDLMECLSSVGHIVNFELHHHVESSSSSPLSIATVQYQTSAQRDAALAQFDHSTFENQFLPLRVLPFIDQRLDHEDAGLVFFNELPLSTRYAAFKAQMLKFGPLLALSLVPTLNHQCIGYALFKSAADARRAKAETKSEANLQNSFLFPRFAVNDLLPLFASKNSDSGRILAVYDYYPPENTTRSDDLFALFSQHGYLSAVECVDNTVLAFYEDAASAISASAAMLAAGKESDVFSAQISKALLSLLNLTAIPPEVEQRFVYVQGLGSDLSNSELRELFGTIGEVEAAFQAFSLGSGRSTGRGYVLFASNFGDAPNSDFGSGKNLSGANAAKAAILSPPYNGGQSEISVAWYVNAKNRRPAGAVGQAPMRPNTKPRESVRRYIEKHAPQEKVSELINKVNMTLSNDAVMEMAGSEERIAQWLGAQLSQ